MTKRLRERIWQACEAGIERAQTEDEKERKREEYEEEEGGTSERLPRFLKDSQRSKVELRKMTAD